LESIGIVTMGNHRKTKIRGQSYFAKISKGRWCQN